MQLFDARVREVAKRRDHKHEQKRRCHSKQPQARLAARDKALVSRESEHGRACAHEKYLQQKQNERERHEQLHKRNQAIGDAGICAHEQGKREQSNKHDIGTRQKRRRDNRRRKRHFRHGMQLVQRRVARRIINHVKHDEPAPSQRQRYRQLRKAPKTPATLRPRVFPQARWPGAARRRRAA